MLESCAKCTKKIYLSICLHSCKDFTHRSCCHICKDGKDERIGLQCCTCQASLLEKGSHKIEHGKAYCLECYGKAFSKKCHSCTKLIGPNQLEMQFGELSFHKVSLYIALKFLLN